MNFGKFQELWDDFLDFLDRAVQWLLYLFGAGTWPPDDYPNIDDETAQA